jgi:hypothetical protein
MKVFIFIFFLVPLALADLPKPTWKLQDIEGKWYSPQDFAGKYVVIEWINFSCHFMRKHYGAGHIPEVQERLKKDGVMWIGILSLAQDARGSYKTKKELEKDLNFYSSKPDLILQDPEGEVARFFRAKKTPHYVVLGPSAQWLYYGPLDDTSPFSHGAAEDGNKANIWVKKAIDNHKAKKTTPLDPSPAYGCPLLLASKNKSAPLLR